MMNSKDFPRLSPDRFRLMSDRTVIYNCIAWAAGDSNHCRQPGDFWPLETKADDYGVDVLESAFRSLGYQPCDQYHYEEGYDKVVLYGDSLFFTHAARQLPNGKWTSKLGKLEDIEHDSPEDLTGGVYGEIARIMKRPSKTDVNLQ